MYFIRRERRRADVAEVSSVLIGVCRFKRQDWGGDKAYRFLEIKKA